MESMENSVEMLLGRARKATLALVMKKVRKEGGWRATQRDKYGSEQIRVGPLDEQTLYQLAKVGEVGASFGPRALQPVLVRPLGVEEHAEKQYHLQTIATRPFFDGDVAIQPCLLRPVVVPLANSLDLEHNARNVPGERWKHAIVYNLRSR